MAQLKQMSLSHFKQIIDKQDSMTGKYYISKNIAVVRDIRVDNIIKAIARDPVLLDEMRLLIVKSGSANPTINLVERKLTAGDILFVGPSAILQYNDCSPDIHAIGFSLSNDAFHQALGKQVPRAFDGHQRDFILHLTESQIDYIDRLHLILYESTKDVNASEMSLHLIAALLWYIDSLWNSQEREQRLWQSREQRLFSDFIQLVNEFSHIEHNIDFYASKLCLSTRYMSTIIRKTSGKSAKKWIDDAIVTRIKIELRHTTKPLTLISDELAFANPSFFSKYFKRMTGMTPLEYRNHS